MSVLSCGPASGEYNSQLADEEAVRAFVGLETIERGSNNDWELRWKPVDASNAQYAIFSAKLGDAFNFSAPEQITENAYWFYKPKNIFVAAATCFVVRVSNYSGDKNEVQKCTTDTPFRFEGIQTIERLTSGKYRLNWQNIPVTGVIYSVFERVNQSDIEEPVTEFDFNFPSYDNLFNNYYQLETVQERGNQYCFVVRYTHPDLPEDKNKKEICAAMEDPLAFSGIETADATSSTTVTITWPLLDNEDIIGYQIYSGSDFNELVAEVAATVGTYTVTGLVPGNQYTFGVRAIDQYGRRDKNRKSRAVVLPISD